jgi:RNA polymerase sigma-70 factor (ECF subfamily)
MPSRSPENPEAAIDLALDAGDLDLALTCTVRAYGGEILGFMESRLKNPSDARESFGWFVENLWNGLARFERHCSMRTFAYAVARITANRYYTRELAPRRRNIPLSQVTRLSLLKMAEATLEPEPAQDERIARLRAQLTEQEQTLLTLRVDRELPWKEVARILVFDGARVEESELERETGRLRQQFHALKIKLRAMAE